MRQPIHEPTTKPTTQPALDHTLKIDHERGRVISYAFINPALLAHTWAVTKKKLFARQCSKPQMT